MKKYIYTLLMLTVCNYLFAQSNPTPFDLSTANYSFTQWANTNAAGTYPASMYFHWVTAEQTTAFTGNAVSNYDCAYNKTSRPRIIGQGNNGFSFIQTSSSQFNDCSSGTAANRFVGAALLGLNTTGRANVKVSWVGGTVTIGDGNGTPSNPRVWKLRLQYRVGTAGAFTDVPGPIEYTSTTTVNSQTLPYTTLPVACENQAVVQLRWIYFQSASGNGGTRPEMRIDDVSVISCPSGAFTPTVNITPSSPAICKGDSVRLIASTPFGLNADIYSWTPSTGLNTTNNDTIWSKPTSGITYAVNLTDYCGNTGTANVALTVYNLPAVSAGSDKTICVGSSTSLSASGASTYLWSNASTAATITPAPLNTTTYIVTGTDVNNCKNKDTVVVNVNSLPVIVKSADTTLCIGASSTINVSGGNSYTWDNGLSNTNSNIVNPTNTTTYHVTVTNINSCSKIDSVKVTVNALPIVSLNNDTALCFGSSVVLVAGGGNVYQWNLGLGSGNIKTLFPDSTRTYIVTVTDVNSCVKKDSVVVMVNYSPIISITPSTNICIGDSTTIVATGGGVYSWNNGLSSSVSHNVSPNSNTTYTVVVTDLNGCSSTANTSVNVNLLPVVNISNDTTLCAGSSVNIFANGGNIYTWDNGLSSVSSHIVAPTSSITYHVNVTDANNCSSLDSVKVTVNSLPIVNAGNDFSVCTGTSTMLTASGNASSYSWNNSILDGVAFTPVNTLSYILTGTGANSCVNKDTVLVTIKNLPMVNAGNDFSVCAGAASTLTALGNALSYSWNNNVLDGVAFTPINTLSYILTGTGTNSCVNKDTVVVTIKNLPIVNAGNDFSVCAGSSATLVASGNAASYTWNNSVSDGVAFVPTNTLSYIVTSTGANLCTNKDTVVVTVKNLPIVNAGSDVSICAGNSTTLTASGNAASYTWNNSVSDGVAFVPTSTLSYILTGIGANSCAKNDTVIVTIKNLPSVNAGNDFAICSGSTATLVAFGNATSYTWNNGVQDGIAFTPTGTLSYILTGISANLCSNADTISVVVNNLPNVVAGNDFAVCSGNNATLTASGNATNYTWNNNVQNGILFTPTITLDYILTGTLANSCSNSDTITITVNELPIINLVAQADTLCNGSSTSITVGGLADSYLWNTGSVQNTINVSPTNSIYYSVIVTANNCSVSDSVMITVMDSTIANFSYNVSGQQITFDASQSSNVNLYDWNFGDGNTDNGVSVVNTYANSAIYTVVLTTSGYCNSDTSMAIIDLTNPLGMYSPVNNKINLYPNPNTGKIVYLSSFAKNVVLFDYSGKKMLKFQNVTNINLSELKAGIYFVVIDNQFAEKLILE